MTSAGASWQRLAQRNRWLEFVDTNLRGAGQVMLQDNPLTGLLFLIGIWWAALAAGTPAVAVGALLGLVLGTVTAIWANADAQGIRCGMYGFNGLLVGAAIPTFLHPDPIVWLYVVLGSIVSTIAMLGIAAVMKTWETPALTFPFVLTTWFLLLSAYAFPNVTIGSMGPPSLPQAAATPEGTATSTGTAFTASLLVRGSLDGISQVFLAKNLVTGAIFAVALAVSSRAAAVCALMGAAIALLAALVLGAPTDSVGAGLYGFSAVLTSIAVGSVFYTPSVRVAIYTIPGIVFTVIAQAALNVLLLPVGIPTLTAPFVGVTWLFLLPKARFTPVMHQPIEHGAAHDGQTE
jgi:urea transporter